MPSRVWVSGSEAHLWVLSASDPSGDALPEVRFWLPAGSKPKLPVPSARLEPIFGDVQHVAADARGLSILFVPHSSTPTSAWTFSREGGVPDFTWSNLSREAPLAWGGDCAEPGILAVVETDALVPIEPASQPSSQAATAPALTSRVTLLIAKSGDVNRIPVPVAADSANAFWVSGRKGVVFLFWQTADGRIDHSRFERGWSKPTVVTSETDIVGGWAGADSDGPVFIAGRGSTVRSVRLEVYRSTGSTWQSVGVVRGGPDELAVDLETSSVAVALNHLAVTRLGEDGRIQFGMGALDTSEPVQFSDLSISLPSAEPKPTWVEVLLTGVMVTCLLIVMFGRREQMNREAAVPKGYELAPAWKRLLATIIDFSPGFLLVAMWAAPDMSPQSLQEVMESTRDPEIREQLVSIKLLISASYGGWCVCWELLWGTTLGKRIFECRVLGVDGYAPNASQILIRNALRTIVFFNDAPGLMVTFMLMVMFTKSRQRLGDILANTIVVQPAPPEAPGPDPS